VPIAVLTGGDRAIRRIADRGETRTHCSPPSLAAIRAGASALGINRTEGESLRARLARRVGYFRRRLREAGLSAAGGWFPLQRIEPVPGVGAATLYDRLLRSGVRALLLRSRCGESGGATLAFIVTAGHESNDIDRAVEALRAAAFGDNTTTRRAGKEEGT
jgi:8-amino-7-oxononanoate synthase